MLTGKQIRNKYRRRRHYAGPVVPQSAIRNYLERPLDEYTWLKQLPRKELRTDLNGFDFRKKPFHHQLVCFNIGIELPHFLFFVSMGGGKSKLMLDLIRWKREHNKLGRVLILVLKEVNMQVWLDQVEEHAPEFKCLPILGSTKKRRETLKKKADIYLLNYPCLQLLMSDLIPVSGRGKKQKRKRFIIPELAEKVASYFDMVIFDESHRFLGHTDTLSYKMCRLFTKHCRFLYALTGTPFGRDPMLLWSQFHVIDDGASLGKSIGMFRSAFFNAEERFWGGVEYVFDKRMKSDLYRLVQHRSISYSDEEFFDAPPTTRQTIKVSFGTTAEQQYLNVVREIKKSRGSFKELQSSFVRMRMCTSGFLSLKSDIATRLTIYFKENPKLEALESLVLGIDESCKAIIYHEYRLTGKLIRERFRQLDIPFAALAGDVKEDPMKEMKRFLHDRKVRFLIANSESGSTGTNPQYVANYGIFFESPTNPITRTQAEKRLLRPGQEKHVYLYDLVVPGSVDERILESLAEGEDLFQAVIKGKGINRLLEFSHAKTKIAA